MNVKKIDERKLLNLFSINMNGVYDWKEVTDQETLHENALVVLIPRNRHDNEQCLEDKIKERELWKQFGA